jgi:hypothetical protein
MFRAEFANQEKYNIRYVAVFNFTIFGMSHNSDMWLILLVTIGTKDFSLLQRSRPSLVVIQAPIQWTSGGFSPRTKRLSMKLPLIFF